MPCIPNLQAPLFIGSFMYGFAVLIQTLCVWAH